MHAGLADRAREGERPVLSTMHGGRRAEEPWDSVVDVHGAAAPARLLPWLVSFVRSARQHDAVLVRGTSAASEGYRDLVGAALLRIFARQVRVVVSDATIAPGSQAVASRFPRWAGPLVTAASRALIRAVDSPRVTWCVLSRREEEDFAATWRLRHGHVVFTPFSHTIFDRRLLERVEDGGGRGAFSGGDSLRDYRLLLGAWDSQLPALRIASRTFDVTDEAAARGVEAGPTTPGDFLTLMAASAVVVLPLSTAARSTGQQTYLNAMRLGRPVVVTDAPGVRDHIEDGVEGLVVPSEPHAVHAAVARLDADPELACRLGRAARERVERDHEPHHYRRRLLSVAGVIRD